MRRRTNKLKIKGAKTEAELSSLKLEMEKYKDISAQASQIDDTNDEEEEDIQEEEISEEPIEEDNDFDEDSEGDFD